MAFNERYSVRQVMKRRSRNTGYGMIDPGANDSTYTGPKISNPISDAVKRVQHGNGVQKAREEEMDNAIAKARGQRAYYEQGRSTPKRKAAVAIRMGNR